MQGPKPRRSEKQPGRPSVGIRELKAKASAIVAEVRSRRIIYAVTRRGTVEALIAPVDVGERLAGQAQGRGAWETWEALRAQLAQEKPSQSGLEALDQMRR